MLTPTVTVQTRDGILIAEFWDCLRLDPAPVKDLRSKYDDHLRSGGRPDVVVDLNGVDFAGSAALSGFVTLQKQCRQNGGRVVFCNVDPSVRETFTLSRLDTIFQFAESLDQALQLLQSNGSHRDNGSPPPADRPSTQAPPLRSRLRR